MNAFMPPCCAHGYVLEYPSMAPLHPSYAFPCDSRGRVDLDQLTERQRNDYFYARVVVGNALAGPRVHSAALG